VGKSSARHFFRALIVGEDQFILSHAQYKRILLTGQLGLMTVLVSLSYFVVDLVNGVTYALPYQLSCAGLAFFSFMLNRQRRFTYAKMLLAFTVNVAVFIFASSEPIGTGVYMYFIPASLGALVIFGLEERFKAVGFVLLSTTLFFISLTYRFAFVSADVFTDGYVRMNLLFNFLGSGWASVCILFFMLSINRRWEDIST
jgi:hypothetical protein